MTAIYGTSTNNILYGSWSSDIIDGGLGADTMYGGAGNDIYYVDNIGDVVNETPINNTAIELVSVTSNGVLGNYHSGLRAITISQDGNLFGFYSQADNLFASDTNLTHEFNIKNMTTGELRPVKYAPAGFGGGPVSDYGEFRLTPDGQYAVFASSSVGLMPGTDDTTDEDIFVVNLSTGDISIESQPTGSGVSAYHSGKPDISDDGRYVVFTSMDNLVSGTDANGSSNTDVYWRDRATGETRMVSGAFDGAIQGDSGGFDCDSTNASVTNDGRYVLFESTARNFVAGAGDTNNSSDLFVRDMVNDTIQIITVSTTGGAANGYSSDAQITPNGHYVVFTSGANNLITGDTTGYDIFRKDLTTGAVVKVNTTATGVQDGGGASHAQITPDGRYVVFESNSTHLVTVTGDSNARGKIFVKDLVTGQIEMVSRTVTGQFDATDSSYAPQISSDGRFISFATSNALLSSDTNGFEDVYRVPNPLFSSDEVRSSVSYTLPANVENLTLIGASNINATGNTLANILTGNTGNNILDGGVSDVLIAGVDTLNGNAGNDSFLVRGFFGAGLYNGGTDIDTIDFSQADAYTAGRRSAEGAGVKVNLAAHTASTYYRAAINFTWANASGQIAVTAIENIRGSSQADSLTGDANANRIDGGAGNDVLYGASGVDTLVGGNGNDRYYIGYLGDVIDTITETAVAGSGIDTVYLYSASNYILATNVETLSLQAGAISGTGNAGNNTLIGNTVNNLLNGGAGNDMLTGGLGKDLLTGGTGKDTYLLAESTLATDTINIATGDSLISNFDVAKNFTLGKTAINTIGVDQLNLVSTKIAANIASVNGVNVGTIMSHHISKGIITFDDVNSFVAPVAITASNLNSVISYLHTNITAGNTVAFTSGADTYVFQDGGVTDTLVELVGVTATSVNNTGLAAGAVWVV